MLALALVMAWPAHAWAQATPDSLTVQAQPIQTVAGQALLSAPAGGPSVLVRDNLGAPIAETPVTVTLNKSDFTSGTTTVLTDASGKATFTDLVITAASGGYALTFKAGAKQATSSEFPVVPAVPARAEISTQPADTVYGSTIAGPPKVTIKDAYGNAVRNGVNVTASASGFSYKGSSTLTVETDANGVAEFTNLVPAGVATGGTITFDTASTGVADVKSDTFDVTAKELTVGGSFTASNKPYDGNTTATIATNNLNLVGVVSGDTVTLSSVVVAFAQANVGTGISVSMTSAGLAGANKDNYTLSLAGAPTTTANITAKALTIGGSFTAANKTYDGTTTATIATDSLVLNGVVPSEDVTLNRGANFAQSNIGTGIAVNLLSSTLGGTAKGNYTLSFTGAPTTTANITAKALTLGGSFTTTNKTYDGTTSATIATDSLVLVGVVGSENVTLNKVADFAQSNIGTDIAVNLLSSTLGGAAKGNYTLSFTGAPTTTANITAKELTITGTFTAANKTYDGTTSATIASNNLSLVGKVGSESVTLNAVANFASPAIGTGIAVNLESSTLGGTAKGNYTLSFSGAPTTTANITVRLVTIKGSFTVADKTYDGTTLATIATKALVLDGLAPGDTTTTLNAVANFSQANVGTNLTASLGDSTLIGPQAAGYTLSFTGAPTAKGNITKKELTVGGGFTSNNKIYDGNTDATFGIDNLQLIGVAAGDDVTMTGKEIDFASKNVGTWTVSLTKATLAGTKAGNYSLSLVGAPTARASITKKDLAVGGSFAANDKTYDGNTDATFLTNKLVLTGVVSPDDVSLTGVEIDFASKNAGTWTVSITVASLSGADAANYSLSLASAPSTTANITKKGLTVGGRFTVSNKTYDGTTGATITSNNLELIGIVGVDNVTLNAVAKFAQADVGAGITVNLLSSTLAGTAKSNYDLLFTGAPTTTANIDKASLTLVVGNSGVKAGQGLADLNPKPSITPTGLKGADTLADVTGTPVVYTSAVLPSTTTAGTYPADLGVETNGSKAGNYNITQNKGTLTIAPAAAAKITKIADPIQTTAGSALQGINLTSFNPQAPTVEVTDAYGNKVPGFDVTAALSENSFASGSTTKVATDSNGLASFSNLVIQKSGTAYFLTYSGAGVPSVNSEQFSIIAAAAANLAVTTNPTNAKAGHTITPAPVVTLSDSFGNPVLVGPYNITASLQPAATLFGTTTRPTSSIDATATFDDLSVRKAGTYTMKFTPAAAGVNPATSSSFIILEETDSATISIVTQPGNSTAGSAIAPTPQVQVVDQYGNAVPNYSITAALSSGSFASGTNPVSTGADGKATFSDLKINTAKTGYTIVFSFAQPAPNGTTSVTSGAFNVTPASLTKFAIASISSPQTAGAAFNVTITAKDNYNNTVTDFIGTANLTLNKNSFASGGGTTPAFTAGVLTRSISINKADTGYIITATKTGGSEKGDSNGFDVTHAALAKFAIANISSQTAGAAFNITITAQDVYSNTDTSFTGTVDLTLNKNSFASGGGTTPSFTAGVLTRSVTINTADTGYTITATKTGGSSTGVSGAFSVASAAASQLAMMTQPSTTASAGVAFSQQPAVRLIDRFGNYVTQAGVSVSATIATGSPALEGTASISTAGTGIATFTNLAIGGVPGSRTLSFASTGLTSVTSSAVNVGAGPAARLTMVYEPSQTAAGLRVTNNSSGKDPTVLVTDGYSNKLTGQPVTVGLTPTNAFAAGSVTNTTTDTNGLAAFTNLVVTKAYTPYQLFFQAGGATNASRQFAVVAGEPTAVYVSAQPGTTIAGSNVAGPPTASVTDQYSNAVADITVAASLKQGDLDKSFAAGSTTDGATDADGRLAFTNLVINTTATNYTITFSTFVAGGPSAKTDPFTVVPDLANARITVTVQPSNSIAGSNIPGPATVLVQDKFGNKATNQTVVASLNTNSFLAGSSNAVVTASNGTAAFTNLKIGPAWTNYILGFALRDYSNAATNSQAFTNSPAAASKLVITRQPSATNQAGKAFATQPVVRLQDAYSNNTTDSGVRVTASIASGSQALGGSTAIDTAGGEAAFADLRIDGVVGQRTLKFASTNLTDVTSSNVTIVPGDLAALIIVTQPVRTVAGENILGSGGAALKVRATDKFTNNVPDVSITPTPVGFFFAGGAVPAMTGADGVASFGTLSTTEAGRGYTIGFTSGSFSTNSAQFNVIPATPEDLVILQQPFGGVVGSTLSPNPKVQLTDRFGNPTTVSTPYNIGVRISNSGFAGGSTTSVMTGLDGQATFANLVPDRPGAGARLDFDIDGAPVATSAPFNIISSTNFQPDEIAFVLLQGSPEDLEIDEPREMVAELLNAAGQRVTNATAEVTFAATAGTGGTVDGLGAVLATNGVATRTVTGKTQGEVEIKASTVAGSSTIDSDPLSFTVVGVELKVLSISRTTAAQPAMAISPEGGITAESSPGDPVVRITFRVNPGYTFHVWKAPSLDAAAWTPSVQGIADRAEQIVELPVGPDESNAFYRISAEAAPEAGN